MAAIVNGTIHQKVHHSLQAVRPFLQIDGGDVELVRVTEDGIVEVKLIGVCKSCPMSVLTLRAGIERALMLQLNEVKRVEAVSS
jgi:Fe-S cluster biogenesis protein NfuA